MLLLINFSLKDRKGSRMQRILWICCCSWSWSPFHLLSYHMPPPLIQFFPCLLPSLFFYILQVHFNNFGKHAWMQENKQGKNTHLHFTMYKFIYCQSLIISLLPFMACIHVFEAVTCWQTSRFWWPCVNSDFLIGFLMKRCGLTWRFSLVASQSWLQCISVCLGSEKQNTGQAGLYLCLITAMCIYIVL